MNGGRVYPMGVEGIFIILWTSPIPQILSGMGSAESSASELRDLCCGGLILPAVSSDYLWG